MPAEIWLLFGIGFLLMLIWFALLSIQDILKQIRDRPDIDTIRARRVRLQEEKAECGLGPDD